MLTLYFSTPLTGARQIGATLQPWTIDRIDCPPLADNAPEPDALLVKACHAAMHDGAGRKVAPEALRAHDLREGLAAAFHAIGAEAGEVADATSQRPGLAQVLRSTDEVKIPSASSMQEDIHE